MLFTFFTRGGTVSAKNNTTVPYGSQQIRKAKMVTARVLRRVVSRL